MTDVAPTVTLPPAGNYTVDPSRTHVDLSAKHMFNTGTVAATFKVREASLTIADPASSSTFHAVVDAASFASDKAKRDEQVRGRKFLQSHDYPDIVVSVGSVDVRDGSCTASASVTAHGVTVPATITLQRVEATGDGHITVVATVCIDRYAHGMTGGKGLAGRWMDMTVTALATSS